jgi:uncharacterized Fe-S cluster protein YjdI
VAGQKDFRKEYRSEQIAVTFDPRICIHSQQCIRGLPEVFDTSRKPWINVDDAGPAEIAEAVMRCPSGALHFTRLDGGEAETPPAETTITPTINGPLYIRGNVRIYDAQGTLIREDTRVALCRCGHSMNKPFCDRTHLTSGFRSEDA